MWHNKILDSKTYEQLLRWQVPKCYFKDIAVVERHSITFKDGKVWKFNSVNELRYMWKLSKEGWNTFLFYIFRNAETPDFISFSACLKCVTEDTALCKTPYCVIYVSYKCYRHRYARAGRGIELLKKPRKISISGVCKFSWIISLVTEINVWVTWKAWFYWILGIWCCKHVTNAGLLIAPHHTSELSKWEMNQANVRLPLFLATSFKLDNY